MKNDDVNLKRLRILGFIKGKKIKIIKEAPLGDPVQVELNNVDFLLSKSMMKKLNLVPCGKGVYEVT